MTRQKREAEAKSQIIRVRKYAGTYLATGGGQLAHCKSGALSAALDLGLKIFRGHPIKLIALSEPNTWRATAAEDIP